MKIRHAFLSHSSVFLPVSLSLELLVTCNIGTSYRSCKRSFLRAWIRESVLVFCPCTCLPPD